MRNLTKSNKPALSPSKTQNTRRIDSEQHLRKVAQMADNPAGLAPLRTLTWKGNASAQLTNWTEKAKLHLERETNLARQLPDEGKNDVSTTSVAPNMLHFLANLDLFQGKYRFYGIPLLFGEDFIPGYVELSVVEAIDNLRLSHPPKAGQALGRAR